MTNKQILFYGDSNTYGYDPRGFFGGRYPAEHRWTDILMEDLRDTWEICAEGRNGRMIPTAPEYPDVKRMIEAHKLLHIFAVMLGTNDILFGSRSGISLPTKNMGEFLRFLSSLPTIASGKTKVLLIAPVPIRSSGDPVYQDFANLSEQLNIAYRELSETHNTLFLDASDWGVELAHDGVHFTEAGSHVFAEKMGAYLKQRAADNT